MGLPQQAEIFTYGDCLKWSEDERWEIIDGIPYLQASPTWQHQTISVELASQFNSYLYGKQCQVFASPFDLCISKNNESDENIKIVLQPDVVIVCDKTKLRKTGFFGVPSLIVEISSPSTSKRDRVLKFNIYEELGVKEYWIVDPDGRYVNVFILQDDKRYGRPDSYTEDQEIPVSIFPDLLIDLSKVFGNI